MGVDVDGLDPLAVDDDLPSPPRLRLTPTSRRWNTGCSGRSVSASNGAASSPPLGRPPDLHRRMSRQPHRERRPRRESSTVDDELLTVAELALVLKVEVRFVRRLVAERRIPFTKVGKSC